jgi:hypothetical protein
MRGECWRHGPAQGCGRDQDGEWDGWWWQFPLGCLSNAAAIVVYDPGWTLRDTVGRVLRHWPS